MYEKKTSMFFEEGNIKKIGVLRFEHKNNKYTNIIFLWSGEVKETGLWKVEKYLDHSDLINQHG